jgi:hypothetical protein
MDGGRAPLGSARRSPQCFCGGVDGEAATIASIGCGDDYVMLAPGIRIAPFEMEGIRSLRD